MQNGTSAFYKTDGLVSTRALTNASGATTSEQAADAFGNTISANGNTPSPFGFAGQHGYKTDAETGLMLLGHRYYDPSTGRFLSRDPIRAGYNWYIYAMNDPANSVDPKGLDIEVIMVDGASHYYIRFDDPMWPTDHGSVGFWPAPGKSAVLWETGAVQSPDPDAPNELPKGKKNKKVEGGTVIYRITDPRAALIVIAGIEDWRKNPPKYFFFAGNCRDFCWAVISIIEDKLKVKGKALPDVSQK